VPEKDQLGQSNLGQLAQQQNQPAAPEGLHQAAGAAEGVVRGNPALAQSRLGQLAADEGYLPVAQSWYTGANQEGIRNGWDTDFWNRAMEQNTRLGEEGLLHYQFEQPDATGVVTWDHDSADGRHTYHFGDVYDNGVKQGNVFDQFDEDTANLMMADILFPKEDKARLFEQVEVDPQTGKITDTSALAAAVQAKRQQNNTDIPKAAEAADFNADVAARAEDFREGHVDEAITAGGAAGGAALGAGIGTFVAPGIGTAIGAGVGAAIGGLGAHLNEDALVEQAARAYEITAMSDRENGTGAAIATGLQQWAGFGGKLISPLSNTVQGIDDAAQGKIGDGVSEFYRLDEQGHSVVPKWVKVADVGASIGDAALQFATPIGRGLYTAQMSGVITGEVGELALTGGKSFDYTRGGFDSIFTDDEGNFSPTQALAGIGKVTIDAVQLGMARGLMSKGQYALAAVGEKQVGGAGTGLLSRFTRRISGGTAKENTAELAGFRFTLNEAGEATGRRATLSLLAPSESLQALSARVLAMRTSAKKAGALSADDFYKAAKQLSAGEKRWTTALVTGMGEGYEEAVQAVLDPYSHDAAISMGDIGNSALYGFAGGVGMGAGVGIRMPSSADKLYAMAATGHRLLTGGEELTRSEFDRLPEVEQRARASLSGMAKATADAAYTKFVEDQSATRTKSVAAIHKLADAIQTQLTSSLATANPRLNGAFVISQLEDAGRVDADGNLLPGYIPADGVGASAFQTVANMVNHMRGVSVQLEQLRRDLELATEAAAADPNNVELTNEAVRLQGQVAFTESVLELGRKLNEDLEARIHRMYFDPVTGVQPSPADIEAEAESINAVLRDLFHQRLDLAPDGQPLTDQEKLALAHAVGMVFTRDPQDQAGSYQLLVPQISAKLTAANSNDFLQISASIRPALTADHDGDKIRPLNELILDDQAYTAARSGAFFLGAGTSVNVGTPKYEKWILEYLGQAAGGANQALANFAEGTILSISDAIRRRYDGVIDTAVLDKVLDPFVDAAKAGSDNAREILLDGLAREAGGQITEFSRGHLSNEWLWLDQLIRASLDAFQEGFAAHSPDIGPVPNTDVVLPNKQSVDVQDRKADRAAVTGATVGLLLTGDAPFRQSQKLHYSALVAAVVSAEEAGSREQLFALAQLYEALGQGLATTELDAVRAKDDITARVYARLDRIARDAVELDPGLNRHEALAVVANLRVADIDVATDGTITPNGREISLAQLLLRQSLAQWRREVDEVFDASPEMQSKYHRIKSMTNADGQGRKGSRVNASRAFIEVIGAQQLFTLLGDDALVFGPHLTVEQFLRSYVAMDEHGRRATDRKLKGEAAYLEGDRTQHHNPPYDLDEVTNGEISGFRAVVDAILAVGHNRITIDESATSDKDVSKPHLHGELAERSYTTGDQLRDAVARIQQAMREFTGLTGRKDGELTTEMVERLFKDNPDFERLALNLIPTASANAVIFRREDGTVDLANWFYKTFTLDPAEAEVHVWRNVLFAQLRAAGVNFNEEEVNEGDAGRKMAKLDRRTHRLIQRLALTPDGGLLLRQLFDQIESAKSMEGLMRWINTTPGIRGEQAPLTAWVDDVADFDADKAEGGWTKKLSGSELREAISALQRGAQNLVDDLVEERAAFKRDTRVINAIEKDLKNGGGKTLSLLETAIDEAAERVVGLGPSAMIYQTVAAARGFYPQAHTKGKNPDYLDPAAALEAHRDAFGYVTNFERVMAALTSVNLDAVSGNMSELAKDNLRTMDDFGRPVEWQKPTAEQWLELFKNPDTRPMARAILFPQAMERDFDGQTRPKLLVGKDLKALLEGTSHKDLFPKHGRLDRDPALKYVAALEAEARKHGGHFSVQRLANDIVIARTSAADHVLSTAELEKMTVEAYRQIAELFQATASIAAAAHTPGTDPLAEMRTKVRQAQRTAAVARRVGMAGTAADAELGKQTFEILVRDREAELEAERRLLLDASAAADDPVEAARLAQAAEDALADLDRFKTRLELLLDEDMTGRVVAMFSLPADQAAAAPVKDALVDYVLTHLSIMERSSSSMLLLDKVTRQLQDSGRAGQLDLSAGEWDQLSRVVIADYISALTATTAAGVSVAPFPDADHTEDQRYYDTTFSYLVDPFFDENHPLMKAAKHLHGLAGRLGMPPADETDVTRLLDRGILGEYNLGQWTAEIPRLSVEANQRLDSSAAEVAIAMNGNAPKTQAVVSAATRRTFKVPGPELLSAARLNWDQLNRTAFDEVELTMPGGATALRPLAQLNNRFARSVVLNYVDGAGQAQQVDLLAGAPNLGRVWPGDEVPANTGYQLIHLDRVRQAVEDFTRNLQVDPHGPGVSVAIEFFHPDSQPAEPEWMNNLFFEGTSFRLDADHHESLNATLWFAFSSISQTGQRNALDASKLGMPAMKVVPTPTAADLATIESTWPVDFSAMLRAKTQVMLTSDLGFGKLEEEPGSEFYNAVYKNLKLRHFVRTADALLTAEQVIAMQARGETLPEEASLWVPSDDVLRSMLGEQGTQGVARLFDDQLEVDLAKVPTYRGVTETMRQRFAEGMTGQKAELASTSVAHRARQQLLEIRPYLDDAARHAYDAKMRFFADERRDAYAERAAWSGRTGQGGFDPKANLGRALQRADGMLRAENIAFDWSEAGITFIGPRVSADSDLGRMLLQELNAALQNDGYRTGWIYREGSEANEPQGILSEVSLSGQKRALRVAPGDLVVVELDSFGGDDVLARKRLDYLVDHGATVVLGEDEGGNNLRVEMANYLESRAYERYAGSGFVYRPVETNTRYQNQRARVSTLLETRGVSSRSHVAALLLPDQAIEENAAWVNGDNPRLGGIATTLNLVPTDFLAGFNVPVEGFANRSQIEDVRQQLRSLDNPEGRDLLRKLAGESGIELDQALTRMFDRFDSTDGAVLPAAGQEFGTGDLIPLVDSFGRILLYRHGYKAPTREQLERQFEQSEGKNVAVFSAEPQPAATTHRGTVIGFKPRAGYGMAVELDIPLPVFGDKMVLEWNGMKYLLTPKPDSVVLPDHGFFPQWGIDLITSAHDVASKEAFDGLVNNHRNAFAYFGVDFLPDVAKFFGVDLHVARQILRAISTSGPRISVQAADELLNSAHLGPGFMDQLTQVATLLPDSVANNWTRRLEDAATVEGQITRALIIYLSVNGTRVEDVLQSGGFNDDTAAPEAQSRLMPRLFTQVFDNAAIDSPLRREMNRRFNAQLHNPNGDGTGYSLSQTWQFSVRNADRSKNLVGMLQFSEAHSSGDSPLKNGMAFDERERQAVSQHSAAIAYQAIGARTAMDRDVEKARAFAEGRGIDRDLVDGGVWRLLTNVHKDDVAAAANWRTPTLAEAEARRRAREHLTKFRQPVTAAREPSDEDETGWNEQQRKEAAKIGRQILQKLNLHDNQIELVDFWVRQMNGADDRITGKAYLEEAAAIRDNVTNGFLPVAGAEIPLLHVHDLQLIHRVNKGKADGWAPYETLDRDRTAGSWDEWVQVALGSIFLSEDSFDPIYRPALDGLLHTYQNATKALLDMPVSVDRMVQERLLDPQFNALVAVSLDANENRRAIEPMLLGVANTTVDDLLGGVRISGKSKSAPASERAKKRARLHKWRKETGTPLPVEAPLKDMAANGSRFIEKSTASSSLARMLINARVGTALINPALYVSMGPEQWMRGALDQGANLITGQATDGVLATAAAKLHLSQYSTDQLAKLSRLYQTLGDNADFKTMINRELWYLRPHEPGMSRPERWLENYAKIGSRMQDPTRGMRAKTLARRYVDAAWQHIQATPAMNVISLDRLIAELSVNPKFLEDYFPEAHQAATNAIAQLRSLKNTVLSQTLRGIYEPLSESTHSGRAFFGTVLLRMPLLFSGYAMNVLTTITGMQGLNDATAMWLHGRNKGPNSLFGRIQAKLRGEQFDPQRDAEFDMSTVMEGIDLTRSFIRGGLTHSALFMFGMMASGLGLSGEDDETKKRRRLAQLQGAGFVYDPRRIENDFRNADALFVDWLPFNLDSYFRVTGDDAPGGARSMAQAHWMLKQFISPIIGMERFYETGDFHQVTWGFQDALGSFPLINTLMWDDAVSTASEMAKMADDEQKLGGPSNMVASAGFLTNAVGVYERMLFENSFVNMIYTGHDRYDRDPYALPLRDSDGTIQRDIEGQARKQNISLEKFVDPETGQVREGYMGRDYQSGMLHALTENRATLAAFMWALPGYGDEDYWRYNMPIKTREIEKDPVSKDEAEAFVRAAVQGAGGLQNLTADELSQIWKNQAKAAGVYVDWSMLDDQAAAAEQLGAAGTGQPAALSMLDKDGREVLTKAGAWGVVRGLAKGSVQLGDASLAGIYITPEVREEIQKEWMAELIQEGVNMGLDQTKATSRMKRLWFGPLDDPSIQGLGDILWSKDISYSDTATYNQLNTTYVMGPDGRPWATGWTRDGIAGALGLKPLKRAYVSEQGATGTDNRLNTTDLVNGLNTGLRALELVDETRNIPTDVEIGKKIEDAIKEASAQTYTPYDTSKTGGGGYGGYGGYGYRSYGGGYGGGGSGYFPDFTRMYALPNNISPYGNNIPFINTSNPIIRRADVRRERVWSERGRLKQWQ
jgi:hypothetical protein